MAEVRNLITENLDIWSAAIKKKAATGRGSNSKSELTGIKKLRELILELAMRGKLVPQDPAEKPASVLLEKIAEEKTRLIVDKKIKKQKSLPDISYDEKKISLPKGWDWIRLTDIALIGTGATPSRDNPAYYEPSEHNWVTSGETSQEYIFKTKEKISSLAVSETNVSIYPAGTLVIAMYGQGKTRGQITELQIEAGTNQACAAIQLLESSIEHRAYIKLFFQKAYEEMRSLAEGGAQPNLNVGKVSKAVVPIPPLAEQNRIVQKVKELMTLCDQLEQQTEDSIQAHQTLVEVLLDTLTNSVNSEDFQQNWQRIAEHFDTLFTTEHSVDHLKQTILQLAVMGKLVQQDPDDEPASVLLEKIAAKKAQLIADNKIKKQKPLPEITEEEKPFDLPQGWVWTRLQDVIDVRDGTHDSPKEAIGENTFPLVTSKDFKNGKIDFKGAKRISSIAHEEISKRSKVDRYDILFSMIGGNIGNQVIVEEDRPFSIKNVALFKYFSTEHTLPYFIKIFTEELAIELQHKSSGGAQPFVSLKVLRSLVFALPPVSEQLRIISKTNELITLCEQLKTNIQQNQITKVNLAETLVKQGLS